MSRVNKKYEEAKVVCDEKIGIAETSLELVCMKLLKIILWNVDFQAY